MPKIYIIAEAGVNHNGRFEVAKKLIHAAAQAHVDCVKFQTFHPSRLVSAYAEKADYQKKNTGSEESQLEMLEKLTLTEENYAALAQYAQDSGLDFCSTPFDLESIESVHTLGVKFWKIPSGEITNYPYLVKIAQYNEPIVLSTGMSTTKEIESALSVIHKYCNAKIVLLHCNTEYPTPYEDVNLLALRQMREYFKCEVGYSDHTLGIEIPIAAAALGAAVIEKHFTLDRNMEGPDHKASLEPDELADMVARIRHVEQALGTGEKIPSPSEKKNIAVARKSIVAACPIKKGEVFSETNLTTKRPGTGISPMRWTQVLGTRAVRDFTEDELIEL